MRTLFTGTPISSASSASNTAESKFALKGKFNLAFTALWATTTGVGVGVGAVGVGAVGVGAVGVGAVG